MNLNNIRIEKAIYQEDVVGIALLDLFQKGFNQGQGGVRIMMKIFWEYRFVILPLLLLLIALFTIDSYLKYKKGKYSQPYYAYGSLLISIAILLTIIRSIMITILQLLRPISVTTIIVSVIISIIGILGMILVVFGEIKERDKNKIDLRDE